MLLGNPLLLALWCPGGRRPGHVEQVLLVCSCLLARGEDRAATGARGARVAHQRHAGVELDGSSRGHGGTGRNFGRSGGPGAGGRLLLDLSARLHVLWPVVLLTRLVAVVGVPAAIVLGLVQTVATLYRPMKNERKKTNVTYMFINLLLTLCNKSAVPRLTHPFLSFGFSDGNLLLLLHLSPDLVHHLLHLKIG